MAHLPALDGLRGVAVLAVVLYHFSPGVAPGGFLGVDLFFVLSGFLITSLLVNEWEASRGISLPSFWARRARRLLPALFLLLAAVGGYVLIVANHVDAQHIAVDGLAAFTYVANWHFISSGQSYIQQFIQQAPSPLRHMWSLAIEEQFYLVWPLLVVLVGKLVSGQAHRPGRHRRHFRHVLVAVCLTLGVASFVRMITVYHPGGDPNRAYYGTDTRAFIILIGAALGALSVGAPTMVRWWRGALVVIGCLCASALVIAMASLSVTSPRLYEGGYGVVAVLMVILLAAAAQPGFNPLARLLTLRPLVGLGLISYGVYLWHWPVTLWLTTQNTGLGGVALFGARAVVTLAVALASYVLVERPIRRGRLPRWKLANPGVVPALLVTAIAVMLLVPALAFPSVAAPPNTGTSTTGTIGVTAAYGQAPRCDSGHARSIASTQPVRVQLVGNSIAQEVKTCLGSILNAGGATLEGISPSGFLLCQIVPTVRAQVRNPATRPNVAIFFALAAVYADPGCGPHATWMSPVDQLVQIWKSAGVQVYLVPSVPAVFGSEAAQKRILTQSVDTAVRLEAAYYHSLAVQDPTITVLDAGTFLRGADGRYPWRMPCVGGEPGCATNRTVGVRWTDGFHFCLDLGVSGRLDRCAAASAAGERRAASALAAGLLPTLPGLSPARTKG